MKKIIYHCLLFCFFHFGIVHAQHNEFKTYENGLIYDSTTMHHLEIIIDSLNLKFASCGLSDPFSALPQGKAHYVKLSLANKKAIKSGISFEEFDKKFPRATKERDAYIVQYSYTDWEGDKVLEYSGLPGDDSSPGLIAEDTEAGNKTTGWVMGEEYAFHLNDFNSEALSDEYGRMIQYVD